MKSSSLDLSSLKTYAIPLAALVVVGVSVPLMLLPGYESLQKNLATQAERQQLVDDLNVKVQTLAAIDVDQQNALLADPLLVAVPSEPDAAGLLGSLEKLAQEADVSTRVVGYVSSVDAATGASAVAPVAEVDPTQLVPQSVTVSLSVVGPYDRVASFITKVENSIRLTNFTSVNLTLDQSEVNSGNIIASLTVDSIYVPSLTNLGAAELPLATADTSATSPLMAQLKAMSKATYSQIDPSTIQGKSSPF